MTNEEKTFKLLAARKRAERNFFYFARYILKLDKLNQKYHRPLCAWMQKRSRHRQMVLWPRGTYKSTISMAFAVWKVIRNQEERILIASSTTDVATARLAVIKSWMEKNQLLKDLWPEVFWANPYSQAPNWSAKQATVRRKGTWTESSFEAGGTEVNIVGRHYTGAILDDLVVKDTTESERAIEKTIDYYQMLRPVYVPGGADGKGFWEVIDGTRWVDPDLYGWILEKDKQVQTNIRDIIDDDDETQTILGHDFTLDQLDAIRATMTAYQYSCQYENSPISRETAMFRKEDIDPFKYSTLPPGTYTCTVTMDPSRKAGKTSDRSAISCRLIDTAGHWWIEKEWAGRLLLAPRVQKLFEFCRELDERGFRPTIVGIEDSDGLDIPAFRDEMDRNRKWWSVVEIRHRGRTKESRVSQIQAVVGAHRVHIRDEMKELESELYRFPYGRYDDRADCLSMHYELQVGSPSKLADALPYMCPDAIAERVKHRFRSDGEREPIGAHYSGSPSFTPEESWFA